MAARSASMVVQHMEGTCSPRQSGLSYVNDIGVQLPTTRTLADLVAERKCFFAVGSNP